MSLSQKKNQPLLTYLVEVLLIDDASSSSFLFEGARVIKNQRQMPSAAISKIDKRFAAISQRHKKAKGGT